MYTSFFIEQFNEHHNGALLSKKQIHRMLLILDLEAQISIKTYEKDYEKKNALVKKLNELTNRKTPHLLLKEMIELSK